MLCVCLLYPLWVVCVVVYPIIVVKSTIVLKISVYSLFLPLQKLLHQSLPESLLQYQLHSGVLHSVPRCDYRPLPSRFISLVVRVSGTPSSKEPRKRPLAPVTPTSTHVLPFHDLYPSLSTSPVLRVRRIRYYSGNRK